jgi:negative regulator of replication initiation
MAKASSKASSATTVKISRPVEKYIQKHSGPGESVDYTLRKLLKMKVPPVVKKVNSDTTIVKISRGVMDHIERKSRIGESRDITLRRLLGFPNHNGNGKAEAQS